MAPRLIGSYVKVSVDHDILLNHRLWACPNPCVSKLPIFSSVTLPWQAICGCIFRPGVEDKLLSSSHVRKIPTVNKSASPACGLNGSSC